MGKGHPHFSPDRSPHFLYLLPPKAPLCLGLKPAPLGTLAASYLSSGTGWVYAGLPSLLCTCPVLFWNIQHTGRELSCAGGKWDTWTAPKETAMLSCLLCGISGLESGSVSLGLSRPPVRELILHGCCRGPSKEGATRQGVRGPVRPGGSCFSPDEQH